MSMTAQQLECAYTHNVDWHKLREGLGAARNGLGWTLDEAATASGLNRATIHSIENVKREPDLKPDLDSIEQLVSAYKSSLPVFFAQISDVHISALQTVELGAQNQPDLGASDATNEIARHAERFAAHLVAYVKRGLAESDRPPATTRLTKTPRRRPRRKRRHPRT